MKEYLGDKQRLLHILDSIEEIESYIDGSSQSDFDNNSMMRFASVKQLEIIGEAVNHLSDQIKRETPEVDWKPIIGLRNIAVHEYFGIDSAIVWNIINNDLPDFKVNILRLIKLSK
jgi:uncharacterized protein with HEPN domain